MAAQTTIVLGRTKDYDTLFGSGPTDETDVDASIDKFDALVEQEVRDHYPEAEIGYDEGTRVCVTGDDGMPVFDQEEEILVEIGRIAEDVFNRGDWIVWR